MSVTPEIEEEILRLFNANPRRFSPFKAAKQAGVTTSEVMLVLQKNRDTPASFDDRVRRPELELFIVASRRASTPVWDNTDPAISEARRKFCQGTHTMATYREGAWLHLCLIPLARPVKPRPTYFNLGAL